MQGREGDVVLDDDVIRLAPVHERDFFNHRSLYYHTPSR
jgi:hypothetical protein